MNLSVKKTSVKLRSHRSACSLRMNDHLQKCTHEEKTWWGGTVHVHVYCSNRIKPCTRIHAVGWTNCLEEGSVEALDIWIIGSAHAHMFKDHLLSLIAGYLRDRLGNYDVAFYLAGIPPMIGGAVLCLIPWVEARRKRREKEEALSKEQDVTQKMIEHEKALEDAQCKPGESVL